MAKILKDSVFPTRTRSKHPWDEWLDGQVWQLTEGEDFHGSRENFRAAAGAAAQNRHGKVRTRTGTENGVRFMVIQFYQPEED
jgi:hypothetical protein